MVLPQYSFFPTIWGLAVAAVPELGFVLQAAGLGAAAGSVVALCAQRRWRGVDTWRITTAWATLGLAVGVVVAVVDALA
ncbi:MAG: hypothetical protein ACRDLN_01370 [Solirubrobacteraceae bacterium]